METYLVGGAVRDALLGRPVTERDWVVVGATPKQMLDLGYRQVGRDFPVFLHPQTGEEYALARRERSTGPGHGEFLFSFSPDTTLAEDLQRRDFRVNTLARGADGRLIDLAGGLRDLRAGVLRHLTAAFDEDPLRILRGARFAAQLAGRGFALHPATLARMRRLAPGLAHLSGDRVWAETERALKSGAPQRYFAILRDCLGAGAAGEEDARAWDAGLRRLQRAARAGLPATARWAAMAYAPGCEPQFGEVPLTPPKAYARAAQLARDLGARLEDFHRLDGAARLEVLEGCDAYRRPDDLLGLAALAETLARRPGLRDAWAAALQGSKGLRPADGGAQGRAYGELLRQARARYLDRLPPGGG